jgi:hypothetical protein
VPLPGAVVVRSCLVLLAICSVVAYLIFSKSLLDFHLVVEEVHDVASRFVSYDSEYLQRDR